MNPLLLGILALGGLALIVQANGGLKGVGTGGNIDDPMFGERLQWTPSGTIEVPYAGFRGGGVSGTVSEEYLPPLGSY